MLGQQLAQDGEQGFDEWDLTILRILRAPVRFDSIEQLPFPQDDIVRLEMAHFINAGLTRPGKFGPG